MIRQATDHDAAEAAQLIYMAIGDMINFFTGEEEDSKAIKQMAKLFKLSENRYSKEYCLLEERKGQVAGAIIAYPAEEMSRLNEGIVSVLKESYCGHKDGLQALIANIMNSKEAFDGEYYIDNLAVHPDFRGLGISKKLIEQAELKGKAMGYNKISIIAEEDNEKAYQIYKKLGYVKDCDIELLGHRYHHMMKHLLICNDQ